MDPTNSFSFLKEFWPAFAALAANFAFPFVSQLRKDTLHFSDGTRHLSNSLAGIATAGVVLLLWVERHSLHQLLADLPRWYWLVSVGVLLIVLHTFMVRSHHDAINKNASSFRWRLIEGIGLVVYVLAFAALALGFNQPTFKRMIFIPVAGAVVHCTGAEYVDLVNSDHTIGRSPVANDRYQFLLRPHEIESGLDISVQQTKVIIDASTTQPQLDLNIHCARS